MTAPGPFESAGDGLFALQTAMLSGDLGASRSIASSIAADLAACPADADPARLREAFARSYRKATKGGEFCGRREH